MSKGSHETRRPTRKMFNETTHKHTNKVLSKTTEPERQVRKY